MTTRKKHNLFMTIYVLLLLLVAVLAAACSHKAADRTLQSQVELPEAIYTMSADSFPFRFDVSDQAVFSAQKNKDGEYFCNLTYPGLNARLYCTWHRISPEKLQQMSEESRRLAYQHSVVATGIKEKLYTNDLTRVYGIVYDIKGDVATPLQLAITDSLSYFFNASLYFNATPNADSIAPVLEYIRKDVIRLMESYTPVNR